MDGVTVYVDIEGAGGGKLGDGPITSVVKWSVTARLDKAGTFSFIMPANDPKAALVQHLSVASIYGLIGGSWQYLGGGLIDQAERSVADDGTVLLAVSGDDLLREFTYDNLVRLQVGDVVTPVSHAAALEDVMAATSLAAYGWTWAADPTPSHDEFYGQFNYDTPLAALRMLADRADSHFLLTGKRQIAFDSTWDTSGLRAIRSDGDLAAETCAITSLQVRSASMDIATTIYAQGGGVGGSVLNLYQADDSTLPTGYILYKDHTTRDARLVNSDLAISLNRVINWAVQFKEIAPISNTAADTLAASNELLAVALTWLRKHGRVATSYSLSLAGCSQLLRPLQTLRVDYRDPVMGLTLAADMYILEVTHEGAVGAPIATKVVVADSDWWPESDAEAVASSIKQGRVYQVHPQMNANSYVIAYARNVDETEEARFYFRFDDEVWQIARATFDFQLLVMESTVKSVGSSSATSSANGDHTHTVTIDSHTHTVSISGHTHDVTVPDHNHDVPAHQHYIGITLSSTPTYFIGYGAAGPGGGFVSDAPGSVHNYPTNSGGGAVTTDDGGGSTPTTSSGGSSTPTSSSGGSSTPTSASGGSHTHDVTPTISTVYGIFRDSAGNLFALADLEYSLDGSTWYAFTVGVNGYASLGSGWNRIDITTLISDTSAGGTFAPLQSAWLLRIRRKSTGATGKKATVEAQLTVRSIIRSYAFA